MANNSMDAASTLVSLLRGSNGVGAVIADARFEDNRFLPEIADSQMWTSHLHGDLSEEGRGFQYPALFVYCDKVTNLLREKFRKFSGKVRLNVEIRASQNRFEGLDETMAAYVDAVTEVLQRNQGDWGRGMSYSGAYEVTLEAIKRGGKGFVQTAKVILEVDVSQDE